MSEAKPENILVISTLQQVHDILWSITNGSEFPFPDKFVFEGDLAAIDLKFEGPSFHQSVPGSFARGLWGFQEEVYRAVVFALYETDDLRRLSKEDLQNFNLVFQVRQGSSWFEAGITGFLTELGKGLSNMDDTHKLAAILGVSVVLATGYAAARIGKAHFEAQTKKIESQGAVRVEEIRSEGETRRLAEVAKIIDSMGGKQPIVEAFKTATAEGTKQAIKAAPDATSATYGVTSFDQDAIREITARSSREATERVTLKDWFVVTGHKRPAGADVARFSLASKDTELSAIIDLSEGGPLSQEQRAQFWEAVQTQTPLYLQVIVISKGGVVKQAVIDEMPEPESEGFDS